MVQKKTTVLRQLVAQQDCCHHWLIEGAIGPSSRGVCKFCNEEREFSNGLDVLPKDEGKGSILWLQASDGDLLAAGQAPE